jgi:heterodisulfide reductase subunit A-like polyferredoxin
MEIAADLVTLASAVMPNKDEALAQFFKVPLNDDGFFVEKHAKLGPSEFATDGVFLCGMAHYPKPIDEAIAQGRASLRAITLLAKETINTSGTVAETEPSICSSCGVCVSICPYAAPSFIRGRCAHACRQGPDQSGAVQGLRPVRGLMPLRRDSSKGLRQQPDFCTDLHHERSDMIHKCRRS